MNLCAALSALLAVMVADAGLTVADVADRAVTPTARAAALLDGRAVWSVPELYRVGLALDHRASDLLRLAEHRAGVTERPTVGR